MARKTKDDSLHTRSQILEAAEQAFYRRGMARTTLADIATLAGVSRGAIYWHFENKAALVQALLDSMHEPFDELAKAIENANEINPLGCMRTLLIHVLQQVALDPKTRRINEILFHKCEFIDEMCDLRRQRHANSLDCHLRIELALRNGVHRGQLPATLNTARASRCLHAYIEGTLAQWLLTPEAFDLYKDAECLVDCVLDMLRHSPSLQG